MMIRNQAEDSSKLFALFIFGGDGNSLSPHRKVSLLATKAVALDCERFFPSVVIQDKVLCLHFFQYKYLLKNPENI